MDRQYQKSQNLCAAAARALSNEPRLHFRGDKLYRDQELVPIHAAHLRDNTSSAEYGIRPLSHKRGKVDSVSLRLLHCNETLHQQLCPKEPVVRLIFEILEQFRCETHAPEAMPGMKVNIEGNFQSWSKEFYASGLTETHLGILLFTVVQIVHSRLHSQPINPQIEDHIEATRAGIVPLIGIALAGLRQYRVNQQAYAEHALYIASVINEMIEDERALHTVEDKNDTDEAISAFSLLLDFDNEESVAMAAVASGRSPTFHDSHTDYQVFTTQYDREIHATKLVRKALLTELRQQLDERIQQQGVNVKLLSRQLAAILNIPERDGWLYGEEEGYIDGRRLSQLISSPSETRVFCTEYYRRRPNSVVSFLIDCSGSMREHINRITMLVDVMIKALGLAGISSEVLGFTTNSWNGGKAYTDWLKQGRPSLPGRLNECCHLIFKDAESNWRHTRKDIAALLKADLFKEGIDGEAVHWACQRLYQRSEQRKLLFVISDGCPMDTATNLTNDKYYLDNHLKDIVQRYEASNEVEIYGLGIGLDLSPYYRHNLALDVGDSITQEQLNEIVMLIAKH
ncbi:cobaltochelatase CobT-related protein [Photobacterium minamisatsumaniensis]|uniref:cobaltochelatase CobT-related protein n=1 Tax=Photobacterium minamisatsumaniensis TaxID=2910233 RepID=UPI003D1174DB